ncbi:MAG TPA: nucleotidyl transferase AbiEii/AbiGii toxin family protein [Candidatus Acidoferrales bacterium]|nr:nucleotidyl transferase AbiEii/AbiGii toxin family protein [Candidatus Acidoferrales bacterium]
MNETYLATARMLTRIAPFVFTGGTFALKGGTAINLFVRDMPRLSVDLDLVFPDYNIPRKAALEQINAALQTTSESLNRRGFEARPAGKDGEETKLLVRRDNIPVKVEANYVMRGTLAPVRMASLTPRARETLQADLEIPVVSLEDMYGGKLVAAMDRQHPRDLFDVLQLFEHEGITPEIRRAFVVYLSCHNRPVHEVLNPTLRDVTLQFEGDFQGMTAEPIALQDLINARERMISTLQRSLDNNEREFLLSLVKNEPQWELLEIPHVEKLPGIQWKLRNLERLRAENEKKYAEQYDDLARLLK